MPGTASINLPRPGTIDLLAKQLRADVGRLRASQCLGTVIDLRQRDLRVVDADVEAQTAARRSSVRTPVDAMNALDGTQSKRTQPPPMPSESTTVTSATFFPLAAATRAASVSGRAAPRSRCALSRAYLITDLGSSRAALRRLWLQHASRTDAREGPHSPMAGTGWLHGWRLTFAGEDIGWEGALATVVEDPDSKVFVVLYDMTSADEMNLDRWEGSELGFHKKIRCRIDRESRTPQRIPCWRGCTSRCLGGRTSVGALPRRHGGRRGDCGRTGRLCPRHPDQARPQHRSRNPTADRLRSSRPVRRCWSAPAPRSPTRAHRCRTSADAGRVADRLRPTPPTAPSHRAPPRGTRRSPPASRLMGVGQHLGTHRFDRVGEDLGRTFFVHHGRNSAAVLQGVLDTQRPQKTWKQSRAQDLP